MKNRLLLLGMLCFAGFSQAQTAYAMTYESVVTQSDYPIMAKVGTTINFSIKSNADYAEFNKTYIGKKANSLLNQHLLLDAKNKVTIHLNDEKMMYSINGQDTTKVDSARLVDGHADETVNGFKCHLYTLDGDMTKYKVWIDQHRDINPAVSSQLLSLLLGPLYTGAADLPGLIVKIEYEWKYEKKQMHGYYSLLTSDRNPVAASAISMPWTNAGFKAAIACVKVTVGKDGKATYLFADNPYMSTGTYKERVADTEHNLEKLQLLYKKVTGSIPAHFECSSIP